MPKPHKHVQEIEGDMETAGFYRQVYSHVVEKITAGGNLHSLKSKLLTTDVVAEMAVLGATVERQFLDGSKQHAFKQSVNTQIVATLIMRAILTEVFADGIPDLLEAHDIPGREDVTPEIIRQVIGKVQVAMRGLADADG
jgi:hypothetical protein